MKTTLNPPVVNTLQMIEKFHGSIRETFGEIRPLHFELKRAKIAKIKEVIHELLVDSSVLTDLLVDTPDAHVLKHESSSPSQEMIVSITDSKSLLRIFDSILFQIQVAVNFLNDESQSFEHLQFRLFQISFVYGRLFEITDMLFQV